MSATNYQRLGQYIPRICGFFTGIYLLARNYLKSTENVAIERELRYNPFDPEHPVYKVQINHPEDSIYNSYIYKTFLPAIVSRTADCSTALMIFMSKLIVDRNLNNKGSGHIYAGINFATTFSAALYMHFFEQARDGQFVEIEKLANNTLNSCANIDDDSILRSIETAIIHKQQSLWEYCYVEQGVAALNLAISICSVTHDAHVEIANQENPKVPVVASTPTRATTPPTSPMARPSGLNLEALVKTPTPSEVVEGALETIPENRADYLTQDLLKVIKPVADLIPTWQRYVGPGVLLGRIGFCDTAVHAKEKYKQDAEFFAVLQAVQLCGSKDILQDHYKCAGLKDDSSISEMLKAVIAGECVKTDVVKGFFDDDEELLLENESEVTEANSESVEIMPSGEIPNSTPIAIQ